MRACVRAWRDENWGWLGENGGGRVGSRGKSAEGEHRRQGPAGTGRLKSLTHSARATPFQPMALHDMRRMRGKAGMASSWSSWSLWIEQSATRCHNLLLYYMYDVPTRSYLQYLSPVLTYCYYR